MLQGRYEFMNVLTGKIINRHKVNIIKITQEVIDIIDELTKKNGIKSLLNSKYRKEGKNLRG